MKSSILQTNPTPQTGFMRYGTKSLYSIFIFLALLYAGALSAQTVGTSNLSCDISNRNPCTSKDLEIVSLAIDAPLCDPCTPGQQATYPLKMTIHNGTKSVRTSFSLYGTLSSGASINGYSGNVFICVGEITVKSDETLPGETAPGNQTFAVGTITFTCGQDLALTNNFLAWTDASGETVPRCETYAEATTCSDIAPKCGTAASIAIIGPPSALVSDEFDPCRNATNPDGKIKITPSGGKAPYSIVVFKSADGTCPATVPAGTPVVNQTGIGVSGYLATGLSAGTYCCYVTDANGCKVPVRSVTIGKDCCTPPGAPTVCQVPADLCGDGKVTLKVSGTVKDAVYHVKQAGTEVTGSPKTASADGAILEFKVVPGGGNIEVWGVTSTGPDDICVGPSTTSDCANSPNGIGVCSSEAARLVNKGKITDQAIVLKKQHLTNVLAAPNPYNDRVRFTLTSEVTGKGSLELFNTLGQRVKTVFQGQVTAGQAQTIEYTVPGPQRANLIYVFRVGNQQTTGKLIGPK